MLSEDVVFRDFGGSKNLIPIKGQLAKKGVIIELNEEAFQILKYLDGNYKRIEDILSYLRNMFVVSDDDLPMIEELLEDLTFKKIVIKVND